MPQLPVDTNDHLPTLLLSPIFILFDALLSFSATIFSAYSLIPNQPEFKIASATCNFVHAFISGPLAEASIRKRNFEAAETKGVWLVWRNVRGRLTIEGGDGEGRSWVGRAGQRGWLLLCVLLPIDNLVGFTASTYDMCCNNQKVSPSYMWTTLFDLCTFLKRTSSLIAGCMAARSISHPDATFDVVSQALNVFSVVLGKLGSVCADLAKEHYDLTGIAIAAR